MLLFHIMNLYLLYAIQFLVILFAISIHEAAHAWMADRCGDPTARLQGRVTLNPIPHIDPFGTIIFPLILVLIKAPFIFGWAKPVMVNPYNLRDPRRDGMLISAAGPLSNIITGIIAIGVYILFFKMGIFVSLPILTYLVYFLIMISFILAIFNLLPVPPLDGSGIMEGILKGEAFETYQRIKPYGFIILIALLYFNILDIIFFPIIKIVNKILPGF